MYSNSFETPASHVRKRSHPVGGLRYCSHPQHLNFVYELFVRDIKEQCQALDRMSPSPGPRTTKPFGQHSMNIEHPLCTSDSQEA